MSTAKKGTSDTRPSGPALAADDVWVGVEEALGMAREAGLGEEALLGALRRGGVRTRGYHVPTEAEAGRAAGVVPVDLTTEFWCAQSGVRQLWEDPGSETSRSRSSCSESASSDGSTRTCVG